MSITLENSFRARGDIKEEASLQQRAHFLPSHVSEDGVAHVQKYFEPYVTKNDNGDLTGTFRGRPLDGAVVQLPPGHRAVLVTEARQPLSEDAHRTFQVAGGFTELVYWNYDVRPSRNDALTKALDWIDIAAALHGD